MEWFLKYKLWVLPLVAAGCLLPGVAGAQHYVGVRGGIGGGTTRIFPKEETKTLWGLYNAGVSWKYYSPEKYVGGVQADILFMQQGYKTYDSPYTRENREIFDEDGEFSHWKYHKYDRVTNPTGDSTIHETRYVNSIMVPLFWQPHVYMFRRNMRVFLNLGVTFSYNIGQEQSIVSDRDGEIEQKSKYPTKLYRDNSWGYGLCGGGGIGWSFGRVEVLGEVRYYIGYSDLMKNRNKYRDNPLRSPLDGLQGSVGIYYRFGKKGILSPPSKNMERKLREIEEKRRERAGTSGDEGDPMQDELYVPSDDPLSPQDNEGGTISDPDPGDMAIAAL